MTDASDFGVPDDLAREGKFQALTRIGFVARGILYIVIGLLVILSGRSEDFVGALEELGDGIGWWLLILFTAGLATYGAWRVADCWLGMDSGRHSNESTARRIAAGVAGAVYLYLAYKALQVVLLGRTAELRASDQAEAVLHLPGGGAMLGIAALVLALTGAGQLVIAGSCTFLEPLDERARAPFVKWLGRIGYAARGIVFLVVALLFARAAFQNQAAEAGGMEQALDLLISPARYAVAAGLILFGAFSIVEARFRQVSRPPVEMVKQDVKETMSA